MTLWHNIVNLLSTYQISPACLRLTKVAKMWLDQSPPATVEPHLTLPELLFIVPSI